MDRGSLLPEEPLPTSGVNPRLEDFPLVCGESGERLLDKRSGGPLSEPVAGNIQQGPLTTLGADSGDSGHPLRDVPEVFRHSGL